MGLEDKLNTSKNNLFSSRLLNYSLVTLLALSSIFGCREKPLSKRENNQNTNLNKNPIITSTLKSIAFEGDNYFDKVISIDPDKDVLTYNLVQAPNGMKINNSDGSILWLDCEEGNYNLKVEVHDNKGGKASQDTILVVQNTFDNYSGKIIDMKNSLPINGAEISLGFRDQSSKFAPTSVTKTNSIGEFSFLRIKTNSDYLVQIIHPNYFTHIAGTLKTNSDKLNLCFELIEQDNNKLMFYDQITRNQNLWNGTKRWNNSSIDIIINTNRAKGSGILPSNQEIDLVERIFKNEIPLFNNNFTDSSINVNRTANPPQLGLPNQIMVYWDDSFHLSGSYGATMHGDEIISAFIILKTGLSPSEQMYTYRRVVCSSFGSLSTSNLYQSIFNFPQTPGIDSLQSIDIDLGKRLYKRAPGNSSPDNNPDSFLIK